MILKFVCILKSFFKERILKKNYESPLNVYYNQKFKQFLWVILQLKIYKLIQNFPLMILYSWFEKFKTAGENVFYMHFGLN